LRFADTRRVTRSPQMRCVLKVDQMNSGEWG
jgi:hypothetical protein